MKDLITVMNFSIKEMVMKKSFIISTIIILVLIVVAFNIPNMISGATDGESYLGKMIIIDEEDVFEGNLKALEETESNYKFKIINEKYSEEKIKEEIETGNTDAFIIVNEENNVINLEYVVESLNSIDGTATVPEEVLNLLASIYTNMQISKLDLTAKELASITPQFEVTLSETTEQGASGNVLLVMILSLVLFYAIFFCATKVSTSVTTEKTSKVMETLVTSTKPSTIVIGKTLGIGLVGLLQLLLMIITAVVSAKLFVEPEVLSSLVDLSNITIELGLITLLYFILGYFLFAFIFALTGSAVATPEDAQSASAPASVLWAVGFYIAYFSMMNPTSELNIFSAYFPFSSPFSVPFRMLLGTATRGQIITSTTLLIITIAVIAKISIKVYSSAILNYGSKLNIKDLMKLAKRKEE